MTDVTLGAAARQTGLSKSTLSRAIRDGKSSAIRRERDIAVLEVEIAGLRQLADLLRQLADLLRQQLSDVTKQRDAWQHQAERLALPRPARPAAETRPATRPPTAPLPQPATRYAPLDNPLAHVWSWLADRLGRTTASEPTAPDNLAPFVQGRRAPAGEPDRSAVPQFILNRTVGEPDRSAVPLNREALLRELERELGSDATPGEASPPSSVGHDTPRSVHDKT